MTTRGEARARHRRRGCWCVVVVSGTGDVWPSAAVLFILASNPTPTQKTDILASGRGWGGGGGGGGTVSFAVPRTLISQPAAFEANSMGSHGDLEHCY